MEPVEDIDAPMPWLLSGRFVVAPNETVVFIFSTSAAVGGFLLVPSIFSTWPMSLLAMRSAIEFIADCAETAACDRVASLSAARAAWATARRGSLAEAEADAAGASASAASPDKSVLEEPGAARALGAGAAIPGGAGRGWGQSVWCRQTESRERTAQKLKLAVPFCARCHTKR